MLNASAFKDGIQSHYQKMMKQTRCDNQKWDEKIREAASRKSCTAKRRGPYLVMLVTF